MTSSPQSQYFRLLDLPFELRSLVLSSIDRPRERAAIARTCKLLREEIENKLYSEVVLRDSLDLDALYASLEVKPARILDIKHFEALYPFGLVERQQESVSSDDALSEPEAIRAAKWARVDLEQERIGRAAELLINMKKLQSLSIRPQDLRPYTEPDWGEDKKASSTFRRVVDVAASHNGFLFSRELFSSLKSFELDPGYSNDDNDRWDFAHATLAFFCFDVESITLRRFDACELRSFQSLDPTTYVSLTHKQDFKQTHLTLEDCELNSVGLHMLLSRTKVLKSLRLTNMDNIWDGWNDDGSARGDKGRWIDIMEAIQKADLHDQLEVLELTSMSKHCTVPELEQPLDFTIYTSLQELTVDAHSSIKGLPESLQSLTFIRPKDFPGACLPLLENRLREVRRCGLPTDVARKVTFKIPDRSRGYESLRVMADTWRTLGFEPVIQVHS